jgi:hypothetical protein
MLPKLLIKTENTGIIFTIMFAIEVQAIAYGSVYRTTILFTVLYIKTITKARPVTRQFSLS